MSQHSDRDLETPFRTGAVSVNGQVRCINCIGVGRISLYEPNHRYCGLCGRAIRSIVIAPVAPPDADRRLVWLVGTASGTATGRFRAANRDLSAARVHIDVSAPEVTVTPPEVSVGREAEAAFTLSADSNWLSRAEFNLESKGLGDPLHIIGRQAPRVLTAQPLPDDAWSRNNVGGRAAAVTAQMTKSSDGVPGWDFESILNLVAEHGDEPTARLQLSASPAPPGWQQLVDKATAEFRADGAEQPVKNVRLTPAAAGSAWEIEIPLGSLPGVTTDRGMTVLRTQPSEENKAPQITGTLIVTLPTLGEPKIELSVNIVGGRPLWALELRPETQPVRIPADIDSMFFLRAVRRTSGDLGDTRIGVEEVVLSSSAPVKPVGRPDSGGFTVMVSNAVLGSKLSARLWRRLPSGERLPLCDDTPLSVDVVPEESFDVEFYLGAVVDFGTSNTCVCFVRPGDTPEECVQIGSLQPEGSLFVPTTVAVAENPAGGFHIWIGEPAEQRALRRDFDGAVYRRFKTKLGEDKPQPVEPDAGWTPKGFNPKPETLTEIFLRQLVLEIRASLDNDEKQRPISELAVSYPSTFNRQQRAALSNILARMGPSPPSGVQDEFLSGTYASTSEVLEPPTKSGIRLKSRTLVDEANAAAFKDLEDPAGRLKQDQRSYSIVFDFGGGTLDIAALVVVKKEEAVHVRPLGMTGVGQLGGGIVTDLLMRLLVPKIKELAGNLYSPEQHGARAALESVLSFSSSQIASEKEPTVREAAAINKIFLWGCAETIKVRAYGKIVDRSDSKWLTKLPQDLLAAEDVQLKLRENPRLRLPASTGKGFEEVNTTVWMQWIGDKGKTGQLRLSRKEIDDVLREALGEAMERARRLWSRVRHQEKGNAPESPDQIILAGGSANIPLLWQLIQDPPDDASDKGGFAFPASKLCFVPTKAKDKVTIGAASHLFAETFVQDGTNMRPLPCEDFLLLPIVGRAGKGFRSIFECGTAFKDPDTKEMNPVTNELIIKFNAVDPILVFFEDMDLRTMEWKPGKVLREQLLITRSGKAPLAQLPVKSKYAKAEGWTASIRYVLQFKNSKRVLTVTINDEESVDLYL